MAETLTTCLVFVHFPLPSNGLSTDFVWLSCPPNHSLELDPIPTWRGNNQVVYLGIESETRPTVGSERKLCGRLQGQVS